MSNKDFEFLLAYTDVYNKKHSEFIDVINAIKAEIEYYEEYYDMTREVFIDTFLEKYYDMKRYCLDYEINMEIARNRTFFAACEEWDI